MYIWIYCLGTVSLTCEWILGRCPVPPETLAEVYQNALPARERITAGSFFFVTRGYRDHPAYVSLVPCRKKRASWRKKWCCLWK